MAEQLDSYRELRVWQAGMSLAEQCYRLTNTFPSNEVYGLSSQIRRAAGSIPANIAEGYGRRGGGDYLRFVSLAQGSLGELETHLRLAQRLGFGAADGIAAALDQIGDIGRMLGGLYRPPGTGDGNRRVVAFERSDIRYPINPIGATGV